MGEKKKKKRGEKKRTLRGKKKNTEKNKIQKPMDLRCAIKKKKKERYFSSRECSFVFLL